jgi:hypothetical protein
MQVIRVTLTSSAVQFRCEDDGKVCQSSVRFPASCFSAYSFSGKPSTFSVQLTALADALRVFAALPGVPVLFTETPDRLVLETTETERGTHVAMYAHLAILGTTHIVDLLDHWQSPATEFVTSNAALREAVEDLEWPQGHIQIRVQARPFQVRGPLCVAVGTQLNVFRQIRDASCVVGLACCYVRAFDDLGHDALAHSADLMDHSHAIAAISHSVCDEQRVVEEAMQDLEWPQRHSQIWPFHLWDICVLQVGHKFRGWEGGHQTGV